MLKILNFPINHPNLVFFFISIILLFIIIMAVNKNYRLLVQKLIYKAEIGTLVKNKMYNTVVKIESSDVDDRMILVLAELMQSIPVLPLIIPKRILIPLLQRSVQRIFNQIKKLLHTQEVIKENSNEELNEFKLSSEDKEEIIKETTKRIEASLKIDMDKFAKDIANIIKNWKG